MASLSRPSHNPPDEGGFKYNPPSGGPAPSDATYRIEQEANAQLKDGLVHVRRSAQAVPGASNACDYVERYISDLGQVIDLDRISQAGVRIGIDPLGGAAIDYWQPLAEKFSLAITLTNQARDPQFSSVPRDWDGKIRMDCSSRFPMSRLLERGSAFDISFANNADADRHGVVTAKGLMPPNDYLATCAFYLGRERSGFRARAIGKTAVSSVMIDRVADLLGSGIFEVPVGFKWFVDGLSDGSLFFCGEESAGSSFLQRDGRPWSTDKDGIIAGLLAAEMTATMGRGPDELFAELEQQLGSTCYDRVDTPADREFRSRLGGISAGDVVADELAGDPIIERAVTARGNGARLGGIKLATANGWIAARPSGTEDIYKIYAESFVSAQHLDDLQKSATVLLSSI